MYLSAHKMQIERMVIAFISLIILGILLALTGTIWGLVLAFQDSTVWGLIYLFCGGTAAIIFFFTHWSNRNVRKAFFLYFSGFLLVVLTIALRMFLGAQSWFVNEPIFSDPTNRPAVFIEPNAPTPETPTPDAITEAPANPSLPVDPDVTYDYTASMEVGYAAFEQEDYQTALINFRRALQARPGDRYATDAIANTEATINLTETSAP